MTHASTRGGLTRRRVLAGAAWTAPVIVSSAIVPAYAASYDDTRPDYGIFTQAFITHQEKESDTFLGLDSFSGPVPGNETANVPAGSAGLYSSGGGKFTPGGSIGNNQYGGAGFWFSAPKATSKEGNETYYSGTTTLLAGARLRLEYRFVFPSSYEAEGNEPPGWNKNATEFAAALVVNPTPENGDNPQIVAFNGGAMDGTFSEMTSNGNELIGYVDIVLKQNVVASSHNGGGKQVYNQILASQYSASFEEVYPEHYGLTTTLTILSGTLRFEPENGAPKSDIDLAGQQAVASIDHVGEPEDPDPSTPSTPGDKSKGGSTGSSSSTGDNNSAPPKNDGDATFVPRPDIPFDPSYWSLGRKHPHGASEGSTGTPQQK